MVTKARIDNGVVAEILSADPFPPFNPALTWVSCADTVQVGYLYDGVSFAAPAATTPSAQDVREQRDALVADTDWLVQRHRDQLDESDETTLTAAQYTSLQAYRTSLRNVPAQSGFPASVAWPTYPL
jgi:hypothetical protein